MGCYERLLIDVFERESKCNIAHGGHWIYDFKYLFFALLQTDVDVVQNIMEMVNFVEISLQKVKTIDDDILQFSELVVHVIWK